MQTFFDPWAGKIPWRRKISWAEESGWLHGAAKSWTQPKGLSTHAPEVNAKDEKEVGHMKVNTAQIQKMKVSAAGEVKTLQKGK